MTFVDSPRRASAGDTVATDVVLMRAMSVLRQAQHRLTCQFGRRDQPWRGNATSFLAAFPICCENLALCVSLSDVSSDVKCAEIVKRLSGVNARFPSSMLRGCACRHYFMRSKIVTYVNTIINQTAWRACNSCRSRQGCMYRWYNFLVCVLVSPFPYLSRPIGGIHPSSNLNALFIKYHEPP